MASLSWLPYSLEAECQVQAPEKECQVEAILPFEALPWMSLPKCHFQSTLLIEAITKEYHVVRRAYGDIVASHL